MDFYEYTKRQWDTPVSCDNAEIKDRIWKGIRREIDRRKCPQWKHVSWFVSAAACAACLFLLWMNQSSKNEPVQIVEKTFLAEVSEKIVLPDGSSIWLEQGSSIRYNDGEHFQREVFLDGSATFDIVKCSDGRRFIVNLPDSYVEVKGTTFSVSTLPDESLSVVLYTGAIDFVSKETGQSVSMKPSNCLTYNRQDSSMHLAPFFDDITWDEGYYFVDDASLTDFAEFLSWKYSQHVTISGDLRKAMKVHGRISHSEPLENVLSNICYMLNLSYKRTHEGFVIHNN